MREIQEVGETTRPGRAASLKAFESTYLDPLEKTIKAKNSKEFDTAFNSALKGCNSCHVSHEPRHQSSLSGLFTVSGSFATVDRF